MKRSRVKRVLATERDRVMLQAHHAAAHGYHDAAARWRIEADAVENIARELRIDLPPRPLAKPLQVTEDAIRRRAAWHQREASDAIDERDPERAAKHQDALVELQGLAYEMGIEEPA